MTSSPNTSGQTPLPNEIQNTQTQSANYDSSHIICGANGIPNQIEIKGDVVFTPGSTVALNKIVASDLSCGVECINGGIINAGGSDINMNFQSNVGINTGSLSINCNNNSLTVLSNTINTIPSNQYFISYGQSKGDNTTTQQYTISYPDPQIGQPNITMNLYGYSNIKSSR